MSESPPSGPTSNAIELGRVSGSVPVSRWCKNSLMSVLCSWTQSDRGVGWKIVGTVALPHCSQALRTICCQWAIRFGIRSAGSFTSTRSLYKGVIFVTPASVAFWIAQSNRSPLLRHKPNWVASGDSVLGFEAFPTDTVTARFSPGRPIAVRTGHQQAKNFGFIHANSSKISRAGQYFGMHYGAIKFGPARMRVFRRP